MSAHRIASARKTFARASCETCTWRYVHTDAKHAMKYHLDTHATHIVHLTAQRIETWTSKEKS